METITGLSVVDVRFPTSLDADGSDAIHDPDFSCAYVTLRTSQSHEGFGITFTIGRGTDIVCSAIEAYTPLIVGRRLVDIFDNFSDFWNELTHEPQMRWLGPEKGVTHLAIAAIINALWDLWAKLEGKPLWKLLVDMEPEKLIKCIPFQYISDALSKEEALDILRSGQEGKQQREQQMIDEGYPAYTTSVGWLGYDDDKIKKLCKEALIAGFTGFKVKVGINQEDDIRRVGLVRKEVGDQNMVMVDANQRWGVDEAIEWMKPLAKYNLLWIEEPTSPDDIIGHAQIVKALNPLGIGIATGEHCANRVLFKQFLQAKGLNFCQIDSCRLAGPNEIIAVYLMAAKFGVPVCPHAGGVGLCELVQHLSIFDYICVSKSLNHRVIEYVDHLHEHFTDPVVLTKGCYQVPKKPGYSTEMKAESLQDYQYPTGRVWLKLVQEEKFDKNMFKTTK